MKEAYPLELIFVRHGESELNVRRAIAEANKDAKIIKIAHGIRDADVPLTDHGKDQSIATGRALNDKFEKIDVAFISPFVRTQQTFDSISKQIDYDIPVHLDDRIREKEFGIISLYTERGIKQKFTEEAERRELLGNYYYRPLGGESYPDTGLRLHSFLHSIYRHHAGKRVLVVTHARVVTMIRKMLEHLTEKELLHIERHDDVANCSVTNYHYNAAKDYPMLDKYNQIFY